MMPRFAPFLLAAAVLLVSGCVRVHPWEREILAARGLRHPYSELAHKANMHVLGVRESTRGGDGAAGGGCGCN